MNYNLTLKRIYVLVLTITLAVTGFEVRAGQPQSTISPSEEQFILVYDPSQNLTLTTSEVPVPRCQEDEPVGDPDYFWDFGSLNGEDNGDGTLSISADTEGSHQVIVYCSQEFSGSDGSYTEQTQTSN